MSYPVRLFGGPCHGKDLILPHFQSDIRVEYQDDLPETSDDTSSSTIYVGRYTRVSGYRHDPPAYEWIGTL